MADDAQSLPLEDGGPLPDHVMREVPRGAFALALLTGGLLIAAWLAIYLMIFLPRGPVA
jgi:hypothetical protein